MAKNIFLSHKNMAKVSNFWLTGDATHSHAGWKLPIKWTAPEAIEDGVSRLEDGGERGIERKTRVPVGIEGGEWREKD